MEKVLPRISRRQFLAGATMMSAGAALELSFPHIPYDTEPQNLRDSTLWRFFRGPFGGIMRLCGAEDKDSNYWQWTKTEIPDIRPSAFLRGNFDTFVREGTFDNVRMSCDGIHEVYKLTPPEKVTWRLIFQTVHQTETHKFEPYEPQGNRFSGKLKGAIKFMRGNGDVVIYAIDENGKRIPLRVEGPFQRQDPKIEGRLI